MGAAWRRCHQALCSGVRSARFRANENFFYQAALGPEALALSGRSVTHTTECVRLQHHYMCTTCCAHLFRFPCASWLAALNLAPRPKQVCPESVLVVELARPAWKLPNYARSPKKIYNSRRNRLGGRAAGQAHRQTGFSEQVLPDCPGCPCDTTS
jgi:hypothetical protein